MNMTTCDVCGKVFSAAEHSVCPTCRKLLNIVYDKARTYLRDNPKKTRMKAQDLAQVIGEDVRLIDILISEGRFDSTGITDEEKDKDQKRKLLLAEIERNLATANAERSQPAVTYGKDRHGRDGL